MHPLKIEDDAPLIAALEKGSRLSESHRLLFQLTCLVLVAKGNSCHQVAVWLGRDPRTVTRRARCYLLEGMAGLNPGQRGRKSHLDETQRQQLLP